MSGQSFGAAMATDAGGGWWRISLTGTLPQAGAIAVVGVLSAGARTFAGNGTSGILVWGPNLTQGLDVRPFAVTQGAVAGPVIFNPPMALTPGGVEMWAACAGGPKWGGANVLVSYDGTTYEEVGVIDARARYGQLTASFAAGSDPDTTNTAGVDLTASATGDPNDNTSGELTSATQAVADASGTLCLILPAAGTTEQAELIAYETATPTAGGNRFSLNPASPPNYTRRGVLNTPIGMHSAAAPFIRLDQAVFDFPYLATQAGKSVFVKFQSFNLWGQALTPLSNCVAYSAVPVPLGSRAPTSTAWTATPTTISNGGTSVPAILVTGKSDNPSASAIEFFYRQTGTSAFVSAGTTSNSATQFLITGVAAGQTYDVAVAYIVNGVLGQLQIITGGGSTTPSGGSGGAPGTALLNDSVTSASSKTFTCPSGSYAHVDIVLTGFAGAGSGQYSGGKGGSFTDTGGGGGGVVIVKGFPVTPGTTAFTYSLPTVVGDCTCAISTTLAMTAHAGTNAGPSSEGVGAAASTGNLATGATSVTAYAGHNGGLTDTWDGGGPGATINVSSGAVTTPGADNTNDNTAGVVPGQGGAGSALSSPQPGGGCNLLIIARA